MTFPLLLCIIFTYTEPNLFRSAELHEETILALSTAPHHRPCSGHECCLLCRLPAHGHRGLPALHDVDQRHYIMTTTQPTTTTPDTELPTTTTMPTEGAFLMVWWKDGIPFSSTFTWTEGILHVYIAERGRWQRVTIKENDKDSLILCYDDGEGYVRHEVPNETIYVK